MCRACCRVPRRQPAKVFLPTEVLRRGRDRDRQGVLCATGIAESLVLWNYHDREGRNVPTITPDCSIRRLIPSSHSDPLRAKNISKKDSDCQRPIMRHVPTSKV